MVSEYDVYLEEYMDLSPTLINGTKVEHKEPIRRTKGSENKKKVNNNNPTYSSMQKNTKLTTTLLLQRIHVF